MGKEMGGCADACAHQLRVEVGAAPELGRRAESCGGRWQTQSHRGEPPSEAADTGRGAGQGRDTRGVRWTTLRASGTRWATESAFGLRLWVADGIRDRTRNITR